MAQKTDWYPPEGGNNQKHKNWGVSGDYQINEYPTLPFVNYYNNDDNIVSARKISNVIGTAAKNGTTNVTPRKTTSFLTAWGQFVTHDMVYTTLSDTNLWPISVPKCDKYFDPQCKGGKTMSFNRSECHPDMGCPYRINEASCFLDGSPIYGSTYDAQSALRSFKDGLLKTSSEIPAGEGDFPPYIYEIKSPYDAFVDIDNDAAFVPLKNLFYCGDPRCNENPMLTSLHILFLREHNRVAGLVKKAFPNWDDEEIFQAARKYVIAELQQITFNEFFYWLLGERNFPNKYEGYDETVDPRVHVFFSTVAFRYGHSEVGNYIAYAAKGAYGLFPYMKYADMTHLYFDPSFIWDLSPTSVWVGMAKNLQQSMDTQFDDVIRNYLFIGKHKHPVKDLMATDIQRLRDNGIPSCNEVRKAYRLSQPKKWNNYRLLTIGNNVSQLYDKLTDLYPTPGDADAFICGLAEEWVDTNTTEKHNDYSSLGKLFETAIISQFHRTRAGDRFWYQLHIDTITCGGKLPSLKTRTLSQIIQDNSPTSVDLGDTVFAYDEKADKKSTSVSGKKGSSSKSSTSKSSANEESAYKVRKPRN